MVGRRKASIFGKSSKRRRGFFGTLIYLQKKSEKKRYPHANFKRK